MQEVAHKIHIKKNGTQYDVNLYDNKFTSPDTFFPVKVEGTTYYLPTTSYLSGDAAGGSTPLRIKKDGTTYQIIKKAECNINIPAYDNQKIVVEVTNSITGNKATYEKTVVVPFGSSFTAKVQSTNSQYNAGSMTSVSSGIITEKNINFTASPATIIVPSGSISKTTTGGANKFNFTVPAQIHVLLAQISYDGNTHNVYVGVTPNKTYYLYIQSLFLIITAGHRISDENVVIWYNKPGKAPATLTISWSSEINTHTPDVNDY